MVYRLQLWFMWVWLFAAVFSTCLGVGICCLVYVCNFVVICMTDGSGYNVKVCWCLYMTSSLVPRCSRQGEAWWQKEHLVSAICACVKFSQESGKLLFSTCIMATCNNSDNVFSSSLSYAYSTQLISRDTLTGSHGEWPLWWLFSFYSVMLHDDVINWKQ